MFPQITGGKLTNSSQDPRLQMPPIPDITSWGEAVDVTVARYLINDQRFDEAYRLLIGSGSNPYDPRREYFLSWMYDERQLKDSALYYMKKAAEMKPYHYKYIKNTAIYLENAGLFDESAEQFSGFVERNPRSADAWIDLIDFYRRHNSFDKAFKLAGEADSLLPDNEEIVGRMKILEQKIKIEPHLPVFRKAFDAFSAKNYNLSQKLLNEFFIKAGDYPEAYTLSAYLNLELKNHERCLADIAKAEEMGAINPALVNVQGIALLRLGRKDEACARFDAAAKLGDPSGLSNYEKHCASKK
jgi:tetratricopeptide (TPR) repeat protein